MNEESTGKFLSFLFAVVRTYTNDLEVTTKGLQYSGFIVLDVNNEIISLLGVWKILFGNKGM